MEEPPTIGRITIAPEVLTTIARLTALSVPGVARMAPTGSVHRLLGRGEGVEIDVRNDAVSVELHIVVERDVNMLNVSRSIQAEVTRAIHNMVGMEVGAVNVHIEDVAYPSSSLRTGSSGEPM